MILFLVEALDRSRFEPCVCSLIGSGELTRRAEPYCAATCNFNFRLPIDPTGIVRLTRFIRKNRVELVQCYGLRADMVGRAAARLGGARVVFSSIRSIDPWRRKHHSLIDRATALLVDLFVANSEAGRQATISREGFAPDRIKVVYSGIPERAIPADRRAAIRAELGVHSDAGPVVGILANLRDMKGHRDVVAALPGIVKELPGVVFLFAGRDDSNGEIERMARDAGVADHIRFLGYVRDTTPLLAAMDVFMLPSHWEGLPASVIEAMHAGLPIITTRVGGIPELVRDGREGLLIPPSDPVAIGSSLVTLARDSELRDRLGRGAIQRARKDFSISAMTRQMEELYTEYLDRALTSSAR